MLRRGPRDCNREIYNKGELIAAATDMRNRADAAAVERWVKAAASVARARLDWYYMQRIQIKHLGDDASFHRALAAIKALDGIGGVRVLQTYPCKESGLHRQDD